MSTKSAQANQDRLERQGFLAAPEFFPLSEIDELRSLLIPLLEDPDLPHKARVRDQSTSAPGEMAILEVVGVTKIQPRLLESGAYRRALGFTSAVLGPNVELHYDHIIAKPPFNKKETAWHQDSAYGKPWTFKKRRLHWWIPLQEATIENGCMCYVAGSHRGGRLPHEPLAPGHEIVHTSAPAAEHVIFAPLPVGGACIHLPMTLHASGPNLTNRPRIAWIFQLGVTSRLPELLI